MRDAAAVRSGDTPQSERAAMLRTPPHILVTTPESLYMLLTAERSREMLKTARIVIVDEITRCWNPGAARTSRCRLSGSTVCGRRLQRIGLSATQQPIEEVARFLVGSGATGSARSLIAGTSGAWISRSRCPARRSRR